MYLTVANTGVFVLAIETVCLEVGEELDVKLLLSGIPIKIFGVVLDVINSSQILNRDKPVARLIKLSESFLDNTNPGFVHGWLVGTRIFQSLV